MPKEPYNVTIAVKAGCEWANADLAKRGAAKVGMICGYPTCGCRVVPGQIKAALEAAHNAAMAEWRAELDRTREPEETVAGAFDRMLDDVAAGIPIAGDVDPAPETVDSTHLGG